jgi:hypothetical protein
MSNNEELVKKRTKWEDLNNIQIFSGKDNFSFAFKQLNRSNNIGRLFCDILSNDGTSQVTFEPDFFCNHYYFYRNTNNLLNYYSMTEEFYLRKIYHYANCTVRTFENDNILEYEHIVQRAKDNEVYRNLLNDMLEIKIINKQNSVAKIPENELEEKLNNIKQNKNVFNTYCSKEDIKILELFYETKTFDRGKGKYTFNLFKSNH